MKLEITRKIEQKETVDIELPYYYKHDLLLDEADVVIYGKVEETRCTSIKISRNYDRYRHGKEFELTLADIPASASGCFMTDKYKSSGAEYLAAKAKLLAATEAA